MRLVSADSDTRGAAVLRRVGSDRVGLIPLSVLMLTLVFASARALS
jgi:hypothetical protein